MIDLQARVINLNRRFVAMWGLPDELVVARDEVAMMGHVLQNLQEPQSFATVLEYIKTNPEAESEDGLQLKDGRHFICVSKPEYL